MLNALPRTCYVSGPGERRPHSPIAQGSTVRRLLCGTDAPSFITGHRWESAAGFPRSQNPGMFPRLSAWDWGNLLTGRLSTCGLGVSQGVSNLSSILETSASQLRATTEALRLSRENR